MHAQGPVRQRRDVIVCSHNSLASGRACLHKLQSCLCASYRRCPPGLQPPHTQIHMHSCRHVRLHRSLAISSLHPTCCTRRPRRISSISCHLSVCRKHSPATLPAQPQSTVCSPRCDGPRHCPFVTLLPPTAMRTSLMRCHALVATAPLPPSCRQRHCCTAALRAGGAPSALSALW